MAVHSLHTVRSPQAAKSVSLHDAREAPALARSGHVDRSDRAKKIDGQRLAFAYFSGPVLADLPDIPLGLSAHLASVSPRRLSRVLALLVVKTKLQRVITVALGSSHLEHRTRTAFQHGHGYDDPVFLVNLG